MSALVALATLLTVELLRAFPALVATRVDVGDRLPFPAQVVVLVSPFLLAAVLLLAVGAGRIDPRRLLVVGGVLLVAGRVVSQLVHGDVGAVAAGGGLLGGLVVLLLLVQIGLPLFGGGVVAGVGLAAALRVALGSRDLIWIDHPGALAVVLAAAAWFALLLGLRSRRPVELLGRSPRASLPLIALAPAILLEAFVLTNLGWVAPVLDRGWLGASTTIGIGAAAGVAAAAWSARAPGRATPWVGLVGIAAVLALAGAPSAPSPWWGLAVIVAQAGLGVVLTAMSSWGTRTGGTAAVGRAVALAPVLLLAAVVALDGRGLLGVTLRPSTVVALAGILLLVASVLLVRLPAPESHHPGWRHVPSLAAVFVLPAALLLAGLPILARSGGGAHVGDVRELRVITYNVALGFTDGGALNLDEVAAVLAAGRPDVVALQEVPRGFLPAAGIDMIGWLQHTLDLPHVAFQPASPGSLHGNAVLSRYPIRSVRARTFARSGTALPRGAISAEIDVPVGASVHVISAHLPPGGTTQERRAQVRTIVGLWGERPRTVLALDANARPDSLVLAELAAAGFVVPESDEATFPSRRPAVRIDFVLHSDDLDALEVRTLSSRASDHLPVLTVLRPADLV